VITEVKPESGVKVNAGAGGEVASRLERALSQVRAPDVVFAVTRGGRRTVVSGGSATAPPVPRDALRYELGSLSKTFTVLLLADLARAAGSGWTTRWPRTCRGCRSRTATPTGSPCATWPRTPRACPESPAT
jgi:hypothetical protein